MWHPSSIDLTGFFGTKRFVRNCLGKEIVWVVPSENLIRVDSAMTENRIMILDHENMASISLDLVLQSVQVGTPA